ncbi:hypothetical protein Gotur_004254 [Gossypium turneri]
MSICCLSTTSHGIKCLIVTKNQALDNIKARFALEVSDNYVNKALGKRWRDHKSTLKKEYFNTKTTLEEKL